MWCLQLEKVDWNGSAAQPALVVCKEVTGKFTDLTFGKKICKKKDKRQIEICVMEVLAKITVCLISSP